MTVTEGDTSAEDENELEEWELYFYKLFPIIFSRIVRICKTKERADFF